jgi:uncharacterized protein
MAGAVGGLVGGGALGTAQRILALASGALMVVMALQFFGVRLPLKGGSGAGVEWLLRGVRGLLRAPGVTPPLAFGVFNGLLPCPLVYAFIAQAVAAGSVGRGLATMVAFGLGTFPAMLLVGLAGCTLTPAWRTRGVRLAGAVILVFGLVTIARGLFPAMPMPLMAPAVESG